MTIVIILTQIKSDCELLSCFITVSVSLKWQSKIADPDQQDPQDPNYKFLI